MMPCQNWGAAVVLYQRKRFLEAQNIKAKQRELPHPPSTWLVSSRTIFNQISLSPHRIMESGTVTQRKLAPSPKENFAICEVFAGLARHNEMVRAGNNSTKANRRFALV
jgi:hypothetical protein